MVKNVLSIDIGGSKTVAGIVDTLGNVVGCHKTLLPEKYDKEYLINHICRESAGKILDFVCMQKKLSEKYTSVQQMKKDFIC